MALPTLPCRVNRKASPREGILHLSTRVIRLIAADRADRRSKNLTVLHFPSEQAVEYGYTLLRMHWTHPDFKEGPRAFAEKREPQWVTD